MMPSSNNFERLKAEIVYRVLDNQHINDECEFFETSFDHDVNNYTQAKADITPDTDLKVYFSIPQKTNNIFITASDGSSDEVQKIIGNLHQLDVRDPSRFLHKFVVRFESKELSKKEIFGVILLPLSVSGILDNVEEIFDFEGKIYRFRLVTMLSKSEVEIWGKEGFEYLMEHFDRCNKDLLTFKQVG